MGSGQSQERLDSKLQADMKDLQRSRKRLAEILLSSGHHRIRSRIEVRPSLNPSCPTPCSKEGKVPNFDDTGHRCGSCREDKSRTACSNGGVIAKWCCCPSSCLIKSAVSEDLLDLRPVREDVHKEEQKEQLPYRSQKKANHVVVRRMESCAAEA